MAFKPLSQWMEEKNSAYYKSPSTKIYDDFATYTQSEKGLLAQANAIDFYASAQKNPKDEYKILEAGVGNGAFAKGFLKKIKELDLQNGSSILKSIS
ncbi:MAG: hypothetical protein V1822_01695, partial [Candidatus Micrarchaeota archaeon]